jgi:hypothetical protein
MLHGERYGSSRPVIPVFYTGAATISFKYLVDYPHEADWTMFQTHWFPEIW